MLYIDTRSLGSPRYGSLLRPHTHTPPYLCVCAQLLSPWLEQERALKAALEQMLENPRESALEAAHTAMQRDLAAAALSSAKPPAKDGVREVGGGGKTAVGVAKLRRDGSFVKHSAGQAPPPVAAPARRVSGPKRWVQQLDGHDPYNF